MSQEPLLSSIGLWTEHSEIKRGAANQKQQHAQAEMAPCGYWLVPLSAAKEEFPEGHGKRRGYFALALECKLFWSTGDDKSKNEREYGGMWWGQQAHQERTLLLSWKLEGWWAEGHFSSSVQTETRRAKLGKVRKLCCLHTLFARCKKMFKLDVSRWKGAREQREPSLKQESRLFWEHQSKSSCIFFLFVFCGCQVFKWMIFTPSWDCEELQLKLQNQQAVGSLLPACCPL